MTFCPNPNSEVFKRLEAAVGKNKSYYYWNQFEGNPTEADLVDLETTGAVLKDVNEFIKKHAPKGKTDPHAYKEILKGVVEINRHYGEKILKYEQSPDGNWRLYKLENSLENRKKIKSFEMALPSIEKIANSNHVLAPLAKKLIPYIKHNNVLIRTIDTDVLKVTDKGISAVGLYYNYDNYIDIASKHARDGNFETVLIHELLHAISYHELRKNTKENEDFKKLYEYAKKLGVEGYPMTDIDEFLVGIFTNSSFMKKLESLPPMDKQNNYKNYFDEILDFFKKLLNLQKESSLFEQVMYVSSNILENFKNESEYLEMLNNLENSNLNDEVKIKPGVQELFDSNPELAAIGTVKQYSQYVDTIFPDSKVKDIVYHGTDNKDVKFYKNNTEGFFSKVKGGTPNAIFFSKDKAPKDSVYTRAFTLSVLLDLKKPFNRDDKGDRDSYPENYKTTINNAENNGFDGVRILNTHDNFDTDVFVVFDPEQIHILGSKQDVEGFKNFVNSRESTNKPDYQYLQKESSEGIIASEKTIRDLAARMSDRIGIPVKFETDRTKPYKGKLENNTAYVNLAYATLDTPIHEILGHAIIRAVKINNPQLYQNLLKELETGRGEEVLDRVKRDYKVKQVYIGRDKTGIYQEQPYTLEEQQEEAIVELLGLMTAEKLDAVKDGKLISLLKRLLKEMKQFIRSLIKQREVEILKLPDNMTLGDLSDLLAYSNSKLILPGYEVEYTTPDNNKFKTYQEASNHISELAKSVEDVDLSGVKLPIDNDIKNVKDIPINEFEGVDGRAFKKINNKWYDVRIQIDWKDSTKQEVIEIPTNILQTDEEILYYYNNREGSFNGNDFIRNDFKGFIEKNKEYEQSKEIIEEWKKVNNIVYNPEEIYSRGQEFSSVVGAYSSFDVNLMMQNLLQHIEDNEKAGGVFALSAYTKPVDKTIGHLEGGGGKIKFKLYPQSKDILWATNIDAYSGSVWDAAEKVNKNKKSELLGVSYTKYPALQNVNTVQPNLASIVDNLAHHHNELGIVLTGNNFRLEYDEDIPYTTKKIIDGINKILDQKYGELIKPKIEKSSGYTEKLSFLNQELEYNRMFKDEEPKAKIAYLETLKKIEELKREGVTGIRPTQTSETLKESIESVKDIIIGKVQQGYYMEFRDFEEDYGYNDFEIIYDKEDVPNRPYVIYGIKDSEKHVIEYLPTKELAEYRLDLYKNYKEKEYTSQALINTKIAALKEVAKKYPRTLIRSEVKPQIKNVASKGKENDLFEADDLPFQKIPSLKSDYNSIKLQLDNLNITEEQYNNLTQQEKDKLKSCYL